MDLVLARQPGGVVAAADERLGRGVEPYGGRSALTRAIGRAGNTVSSHSAP